MFKKNYLPLIISSISFLFCFLFFYYTDLKSLTIWSINIWDTLYETHNIRHFYEYSAMNLYKLDHTMVGSDILIYLPWAIWNLPLWILQHFFHLDTIEHFGMMLYSKCFLFANFGILLYYARKISLLFTQNQEETKKMLFLCFSSLFTVTSLAYAGQNDVLVIVPFTIAIYQLMKEKYLRFLLWSAISIAFKPIFLFSFVALLLLKEKNILKLFLSGILGCSVYFFQKILFIGAPLYKESLSYGPMKDIFDLLQKASLDLPPAGMSIFIFSLGLFYFFAYSHEKKEQLEQENAYTLYYATAPMLIFFLFTRYESYRPFYLVPLLYLLILLRPEYSRINLILETIFTSCIMYFYLIDDVLFYNPNFLLNFHKEESLPAETISSFFARFVPGFGFQSTTALFVLSGILLLVLNHPSASFKSKPLKIKEEPWLLTLRSIIYTIPGFLSFFLQYIMN